MLLLFSNREIAAIVLAGMTGLLITVLWRQRWRYGAKQVGGTECGGIVMVYHFSMTVPVFYQHCYPFALTKSTCTKKCMLIRINRVRAQAWLSEMAATGVGGV